MKELTPSITVNIFGKEYKIACNRGEREDLIISALQLERQMLEIRDTGKVMGADRIAVLVALNLAHELESLKKQSISSNPELGMRLVGLRHKIESALEKA